MFRQQTFKLEQQFGVALFDLPSGRKQNTLQARTAWAFSPDSRYLLASDDTEVQLWDVRRRGLCDGGGRHMRPRWVP